MYSRSEDVLNSLKEIFESEISAGKLTLTHNAATNSVIMRLEDPESDVAKDVHDVIDSLDYRTGQVLIDVLVVELTVTDDDVLNAEWKELFSNPSVTLIRS
jgi:type II secretory pathway component GspD/PulD (secretin)